MYQEQQEVKRESKYSEAIDGLIGITAELPQVKMELVHLFSVGFYGRVLRIPQGTLVVGKRHRHRHYMSLVKGHARLLDDGVIKEIHGGTSSVSHAGNQRVVYAVTDCEFFTLHKTDKTTLAEIEAETIIEE